MALQNKWHLRSVAENSGKPCWIDYKITTSVLITPDNKDFFYICRSHLKDRGFCSPSQSPMQEATSDGPASPADIAAKKREEEIQKEVEAIKKEYEEKKKKAKRSKKSDNDKEEDEEKRDEKERDEKIKAVTNGSKSNDTDGDSSEAKELPRIYALHRNFFQMRIDRIRNAEMARRNRERLKDPNNFPSVPTGGLS